MKAFAQMLRYIWPQWPRIIVVVLSAIAIAVMLSLSFATVIPLLKVMIGTEGLHGWVDRKASECYYGLEFYVPATVELTGGPGPSLHTHLKVTTVAKGSLAEQAGIRPLDYIADVNNLRPRNPDVPYLRLLQELATVRQGTVQVVLKRLEGDTFQSVSAEMTTPDKPQTADGVRRGNGSSVSSGRWGWLPFAAPRGSSPYCPARRRPRTRSKPCFSSCWSPGSPPSFGASPSTSRTTWDRRLWKSAPTACGRMSSRI